MTTLDLNFLDIEVIDKICVVSISREESLNALNQKVLLELRDFFSSAKEGSLADIQGVILTGAGEKSFVAGADIKEMSDMSTEQAGSFSSLGQTVTCMIENFNRPVIAAVNGFAMGGGFELALACDFILASKNAVFALPETRLGLIPGFGGTQRLPVLVGAARAKEIIFSARSIKADEAYRLGVCLEVYPSKKELLEGAFKFFESFAGNSPFAKAQAKEAINDILSLSIDKGLEKEMGNFSRLFGTEDTKEGIQAFLEKRKASFKGDPDVIG